MCSRGKQRRKEALLDAERYHHGQHFPGNSLVHRFDPRLKLVLTIAYIVLLFAASNPLGLALSILFLAAMYKVAKFPAK